MERHDRHVRLFVKVLHSAHLTTYRVSQDTDDFPKRRGLVRIDLIANSILSKHFTMHIVTSMTGEVPKVRYFSDVGIEVQ